MAEHKLHTDRLILRRWKKSDYAPFSAICRDPKVMQYIGSGATRTPEQAGRAIQTFEREWNDRGYGLFAVEERNSGNFIGFTGLSLPGFLPEILPAVEIGWRFSRSSWGKGYATEAATAALSFGIEVLGMRDIVSIYQPQNVASKRIMQKLGLVFDRRTIDPTCNREVEVYRLPPIID